MRGTFVRIASVTDLNTTLVRDFERNYRESAQKIHALVEPLTDEQIWTRPYPYGNSIGHLLLHLTGNLSYYIGAEMGGTGYVRNRPLEFTDTSRARKPSCCKMFDGTIEMVIAVIKKQSEQDWSAAYTAKGIEDCGDRFTAIPALRRASFPSHRADHLSVQGTGIGKSREVDRSSAVSRDV